MLAGVDLPTEILLVRAFSVWFHLANVVQQVHQARHLERTSGRGGRLAEAVDRIEAEGVPSTLVDDVVRRLELRPVFTSHPTQAARRSVLSKMRQVAELLRARQDAAPAERDADRAPLRRGGRPPVADRRAAPGQARAVGGGQLDPVPPRGAVPATSCPTSSTTSPGSWPAWASSWAPAPGPCASARGWAATGTGTPTSPPQVTLDVLAIQHERGIADLVAAVDDLVRDLSVSTRIVPVSEALLLSLAEDRIVMPDVYDRSVRLYGEEPYRLKCAYIRQRLENTARRAADAQAPRRRARLPRPVRAAGRAGGDGHVAAHEPGRHRPPPGSWPG